MISNVKAETMPSTGEIKMKSTYYQQARQLQDARHHQERDDQCTPADRPEQGAEPHVRTE